MGDVKIIESGVEILVVVRLPTHVVFDTYKQRISEAVNILKREVIRYESSNSKRSPGNNDGNVVPERTFPDR